MTTKNAALSDWVAETARLTRPERIHWCTGSDTERDELTRLMLERGDLLELDQANFPNCYLHRSHPSDVARVEHLTFICTRNRDDAGPNNLWMAPAEAHERIDALFDGCMQGRTMYVVPYCMGPLASPYARCGVEITDSPYVVLNMRIMTRMGTPALERIESEGTFVRGLHSIGDLDPERRYIMHFPDELSIKSIGSGYGGNALLGKKCHALRIASWQARTEGWLAEHMLIVGLENPRGEVHYVLGAFPSACGKTNLGMLIPPDTMPGWKVWTIGEDIAWLHVGSDGRLRAINPEAGFFGVVPGTSPKTNRNAYEMIHHDTIFTNVALTADRQPWWEGRPHGVPALDWQGRPYDKSNGAAAHPNSRFTVSAKQNPAYNHLMEHPEGVPISAILFGGRRREVAPLVYEARDWAHGVMIGAGMASETTAAAVGQVGVVRRDSMAMKPFCGYNFADYWAHWLSFEGRVKQLPKVYHVNWFRQDKNGKFLWPGFGDNLRVLSWVIDRCEGRAGAQETPIGFLPKKEDLDLAGVKLADGALHQLLDLDLDAWHREIDDIGRYLEEYGERMPPALREQYQRVKRALG